MPRRSDESYRILLLDPSGKLIKSYGPMSNAGMVRARPAVRRTHPECTIEVVEILSTHRPNLEERLAASLRPAGG